MGGDERVNWLLLRGLVREQRHWMDFPSVLTSSLPGHRAFGLDAPGLGTERRRPSPSTVREIMEDMRRRFLPLAEANPGEWRLLCISLGGMVGLSWADAHPADFARVVLINSSARNVSSLKERLTPLAIRTFFRLAVTRDLVARERAVLDLTSNLRSDLGELAQTWAGFASGDGGVRGDVALAQLRAALSFHAPARIAVPMTVICSEGDRLARAACSRALAQRYGADLRVHETAGHDLPLDDAPWLAAQLGET
jgi:pimeloyl-[acyl-carrier protein] methyl ester esterase